MESLIILSLAVYGLSYVIVNKEGPADLFSKLRDIDATKLTLCVPCLSFWVSLIALLLYGFNPLLWLSVWGLVILTDTIVNAIVIKSL